MNQQVIITQIKQPANRQYPYAVQVNVGGKMFFSRTAMTEEHAAIIAGQFFKEYPQAKMVWR